MRHQYRHCAGGLHLDEQPLGGAISEHSAPTGDGLDHLHGCRCQHDYEVGHSAAGGKHQRRSRHDLHHVEGHLRGEREHQRLFRAGHRPRHGGGQRAEPRVEGIGTAALRRDKGGRAGDEDAEQHPAHTRREGHRQQIWRRLHLELRRHQHQAAPPAHHRRGRRGFTGQHLRTAHLDEARRDGPVRPGAERRVQRHKQPELRRRHRHAGRAVAEQIPVLDGVQGHAEERRGVQRHCAPHRRRRPPAAPGRRGRSGDRRRELQLYVEHQRHARHDDYGVPGSGGQRYRGERTHHEDV